MSLYLTRAHYTPEAFKGMLAKPGDRESPGREMFEAAGMKLHNMWYSANGEVICICEGDAISGATVAMVVMASGAFLNAETVELLTMKQQVEAMKGAGKVAAKYRAPGK